MKVDELKRNRKQWNVKAQTKYEIIRDYFRDGEKGYQYGIFHISTKRHFKYYKYLHIGQFLFALSQGITHASWKK